MGVDNCFNKWDLEKNKIIQKYNDFYTFDFDSAFDIDPVKEYLIGHISKKNFYFQRRVSKRHRVYTFCKSNRQMGHTSAVASRIKKAFFGFNNSEIVINSINTHKRQMIKKKCHNNKKINSLVLDKNQRYLFSGGSDRIVKIYSLKEKEIPCVKELKFEADIIHLRLSKSQKLLSVCMIINTAAKKIHIFDTDKLFNENKD